MASAEQRIAQLQAYVDSFNADAAVLQEAIADPGLPEPARLALIGALNYVLDVFDIFPDNYPGLGVADDAMVLRLAAAQAVAAGAQHAAIQRLAEQAQHVRELLGELAEPMEKLVAGLPQRSVRGRDAARIVADPDRWAIFDAEVSRELERFAPARIDVGTGADQVLDELSRMMRDALGKAGLIKAPAAES